MIGVLLRFACRNVVRHGWRSVLTVLMLAGGLFVLVFLKGLQDGYVAQRLESGLGLTLGHAAVQAGEADIADGEALAALLRQQPGVRAASPRVRGTGWAQGASAATGVALLGVDPEAEAATVRLPELLEAGAFLPARARGALPPAALGADLAARLGVGVGDTVALLLQGEDGALVAERFAVAGLFRSGGAVTDGGLLCLRREDAVRLLAPGGDATEVALRLDDAAAAPAIVARLAALPALSGLRVESWHVTAPEVVGALEMLAVMERVRTAVLFALVAIGIFSTVTLSVLERRREFGVLMALGMEPLAVFALLVLEVAMLGAAGLLLGGGAAAAVTGGWLGRHGVDFSALGAKLPGALEGTGVVYPVLRAESFVVAAAFVLAIALVVLVPPGWRLLRMDPARALRSRD